MASADRQFIRKRPGQIISGLLLVMLCAALLPWPQISPLPEKDRSTPYPCMNRPCGCASAEQCWKSCCCFTNREKLAWAKKNGVTVPDYVVAAARRETEQKTASSCCDRRLARHEAPPSTGRKNSSSRSCESSMPKTATSHSTEQRCCSPNSHEPSPTRSKSVSRHFSMISALQCQGVSSLWQILASCVIVSLPDAPLTESPLQSLMPIHSDRPASADAAPPEPPPRLIRSTT